MRILAVLCALGIFTLWELSDRKKNYRHSFVESVNEVIKPLTARFN